MLSIDNYKKSSLTGFTLIELVVTVAIIVILAGIGIPNYYKAKERAIGREPQANLKLIAAAEKIYKLETGSYYISSTPADINTNLKLSLNDTYWDYEITGSASSFTAYAYRNGSGGYLDCEYSHDGSDDEPDPTSCP